jgi:hypothetical protein
MNVTEKIPAGMTSSVFRIPCIFKKNEGTLTGAFVRVIVCRMNWRRPGGGTAGREEIMISLSGAMVRYGFL